jgi:outer membrane receptor protein involved in Fe transport
VFRLSRAIVGALIGTVAAPALLAAPTTAISSTTNAAGEGEGEGEVIIVACLRRTPASKLAGSAVVLDQTTLQTPGAQHFSDAMAQVPNLNFAGASSRPRYFQVRGIGELEQYEGAPNPSVGFLVDGMDFSGLGMVATLFDVGQIEVLRGPQGARYGANALGGLINVASRAPERSDSGEVEATLGSAGTYSAGAIYDVATGANSGLRLGVQQQRSDGFRRNAFLGRNDTNGRNETTARARWQWNYDEDHQVDITMLHADLDNRYDAFAIDNTRTTLSDKPGRDAQLATGASVRVLLPGPGEAKWSLAAAHIDSHSVHAYDGDWGNAVSWAPYTYDYVYHADRNRQNTTFEARLESPALHYDRLADDPRLAWLVGVWHAQLRERIDERSGGTYADPAYPDVFISDFAGTSRYSANTTAIFGQVDAALPAGWQASLGLRRERRAADFIASDTTLSPTNTQSGGHFTLSRPVDLGTLWLSASRGYKAGGVNPSPQLPARLREFGPETVHGLELGWRQASEDDRWQGEVVLFDMRRQHLQVRTNEQLVVGDPNTFVFFTDNAARGHHRGLETSLRWRPTAELEAGFSLGLLRAELDGVVRDGTALPQRDAPHAPRWQFATHVAWQNPAGFHARLDFTGMDAFYFGNVPEHFRSHAYSLLGLQAGWRGEKLEAGLYVRNALNRQYAVRGFSFGNEPPEFAEKLYTQPGDPREGGMTLRWRF